MHFIEFYLHIIIIEADFELEKLLEKYHCQQKIKHKSLKCLFTGPPRVGKTTLKKRLLKAIKNLITSGIASPSGGLEKPISVIIGESRECVTLVMDADINLDWQHQHDLLDEAQTVLELIDHQPTTHYQGLPTPTSDHSILVLPTSVPPTQVPPTPDYPTPVASIPVPHTPILPDPDTPIPRETEVDITDAAKKLILGVLASKKLRSIKDIEKTTTLYLMDIGGQPEFHEIMPVILDGPALHMVFFNLAFNLDDPIPVRFCQQDGTDSLITYNSSYTGKQMIFQLLSSLYYLNKGLSSDTESAAVLIGTYLDQLKSHVGQGEKKIEEISDTLKELFSNVEFHNQAFLTYPTKNENSTIFIPVNNYSGDEEEIHHLQAFLRRIIDDRFGSVELPSSWLLFHLILRHRYEKVPGVCTLRECRALAKGCDLDEHDVPQVLRYIHRHLGTILFYEDVPGLNELVICDPNVLFRSISQLVAVSFGGDKGYHTITAEIRKTGEIPVRVLERIGTQPSSCLLTNEHTIELFKHYKLLTEFNSDDRITYFMPCLLKPDYSFEISCEALQALYPPPLLVRFDGNYIPMGVFSMLVVKLSQGSWEPDVDSRFHNHILFHTDSIFPVELIVQPAYLEFRIRIASYEEEEPEEVHQFCMEVRKTVLDNLNFVLTLHEHMKKAKFQLGFYCPGSFHTGSQPHFCGCLPRQNHTNPRTFVCTKSPRCQDQCRLPHECSIWFEYWKVSCVNYTLVMKLYNQEPLYVLVGQQSNCQKQQSFLRNIWQGFQNNRYCSLFNSGCPFYFLFKMHIACQNCM